MLNTIKLISTEYLSNVICQVIKVTVITLFSCFMFQKILSSSVGQNSTELFKNKIVNLRNDTVLYHVSTDRQMLELGRSKSWTRALEDISGDTRMDSQPLLSYFRTLYDWLKVENQKNNRQPGWNPAIDPCK